MWGLQLLHSKVQVATVSFLQKIFSFPQEKDTQHNIPQQHIPTHWGFHIIFQELSSIRRFLNWYNLLFSWERVCFMTGLITWQENQVFASIFACSYSIIQCKSSQDRILWNKSKHEPNCLLCVFLLHRHGTPGSPHISIWNLDLSP